MAFKMKPKGFQMKSPNKNYKNPRDYRVFNMGNEADAPMEMHSPTDMEKTPAYMKSPVKHSGADYKAQVKKEDGVDVRPKDVRGHDEGHRTKKWDENHNDIEKKAPTEMKKSGFKMKEGSPFQRNFGVGSPVKAAKPDYIDLDGDGNTTESMKKAAADKKSPNEMASPVKLMPRYIDGVEVTDEEFAAFEDKGKDLLNRSSNIDETGMHFNTANQEGINRYKETLGDDFSTPEEYMLQKNPGITDLKISPQGIVSYYNADGDHVSSNLSTTGYYNYFRDKEDEFKAKAGGEFDEHTGGQDWSEGTDDVTKGDLRSNRVRVTGQDYIDDADKKYQEYLRDARDEGLKLKQKSVWLKDNKLFDGYKEALNAIETGDDGMGDVREEKTDM